MQAKTFDERCFVAQDTPCRLIDIFLIDLGSMCVVCFEP